MKIYLSVLFLLCTALTSCNPEKWANTTWGIWVENRSDKNVYFLVGFDLLEGKYYPTKFIQ